MKRRLRVVVDTNCLLQMLGKASPFHTLWEAFRKGDFVVCVSTEIVHEYEEILGWKASALAAQLTVRLLEHMPNVEHHEPRYRFHVIEADPDDNKFTDCAIVAAADCIVTEDNHFKPAHRKPFPPIKVVGLAEFMTMVIGNHNEP